MAKLFEDYFMEVQTDMVQICFEYINYDNQNGDNIYIYCSNEQGVYTAGFFYKINGKILNRYEVNKGLPDCDVSSDIQVHILKILIMDLKRFEKYCKMFLQDVPTEMKLIYDIKTNHFEGKYKYDLIYSNDSEKSAADIEKAWFEEIKKNTEN